MGGPIAPTDVRKLGIHRKANPCHPQQNNPLRPASHLRLWFGTCAWQLPKYMTSVICLREKEKDRKEEGGNRGLVADDVDGGARHLVGGGDVLPQLVHRAKQLRAALGDEVPKAGEGWGPPSLDALWHLPGLWPSTAFRFWPVL